MVGQFSNVEIYVIVFFAYVGLFSVCDDVQSSVSFFVLPHRSTASVILMWPNVTVLRKYTFPVGTNKIFFEVKLEIQELHNVYKVQLHKGCFILKILKIH